MGAGAKTALVRDRNRAHLSVAYSTTEIGLVLPPEESLRRAPTAQFYHVIADVRFPYRVYGGQQESGSAGVLSRGSDGLIGMREWQPAGNTWPVLCMERRLEYC